MRSVVRRRIGWLLAAIAAHTALDAWAVWGMSRFGPLPTEAGVAASAVAFGVAIWLMREAVKGEPSRVS